MNTTHFFVELLVIGAGALVWLVLLVAALLGYDLSDVLDELLHPAAIVPLLPAVYVLGILTDRIADKLPLLELLDEHHHAEVYLEPEEGYGPISYSALLFAWSLSSLWWLFGRIIQAINDLFLGIFRLRTTVRSVRSSIERIRSGRGFRVPEPSADSAKKGHPRQTYWENRRVMVTRGKELWEHVEYGRSRLRICRGWFLNGLILLLVYNLCEILAYSSDGVDWVRWVCVDLLLIGLTVASLWCWHSLNLSEYEKIERQSKWVVETGNNGEG